MAVPYAIRRWSCWLDGCRWKPQSKLRSKMTVDKRRHARHWAPTHVKNCGVVTGNRRCIPIRTSLWSHVHPAGWRSGTISVVPSRSGSGESTSGGIADCSLDNVAAEAAPGKTSDQSNEE